MIREVHDCKIVMQLLDEIPFQRVILLAIPGIIDETDTIYLGQITLDKRNRTMICYKFVIL